MSQRRPASKNKAKPSAQPVESLPTLEPLHDEAELPTLEALEEAAEGPVQATWQDTTSGALLVLHVPAMEKAAVAAAVAPALASAVAQRGARLRWASVMVEFAGEAVIGSALKQVVAEAFAQAKPAQVVVRRGYGDEVVHNEPPPQLACEVTGSGDERAMVVDTGALSVLDLAALLPAQLDQLGDVRGARLNLQFRGAAKPDAALREALTSRLRAAGVRRLAIGARVLFDQALLDAVQIELAGDAAVVRVQPMLDALQLGEAIALFAAERAEPVRGKLVRIACDGLVPSEQIASLVNGCRAAGAARISLGQPGAEDIVWPLLMQCEPGQEVRLRLAANGRDRAGVLAAFAREVAGHAESARGKPVVVDWPAGFALDEVLLDGCLRDAFAALGASALACTVAGDAREPLFPTPIELRETNNQQVLCVDLTAGKPAELLRALARRKAGWAQHWRGKSVRIEFAGDVVASRTLRKELCDAVEAAGAMRLEVADHGVVDVLLPPMLTVSRVAGDLRVSAVAGDRNAAQQQLALARELEAMANLRGACVRLVPSASDELLLAELVQRGAASVVLDGAAPVRLFPSLLAATVMGKQVQLTVAGTADAAMDQRQWQRELPQFAEQLRNANVTLEGLAALPEAWLAELIASGAACVLLRDGAETAQLHPAIELLEVDSEPESVAEPAPLGVHLLARNDQAVPPIAVLGIASVSDEQQVAAIVQTLTAMQPAFVGRAVLLVLRDGQTDVPLRADSPLARAARGAVGATAAATLLFRGPDAAGRAHFTVAQSKLLSLPVGAAFADPRRL